MHVFVGGWDGGCEAMRKTPQPNLVTCGSMRVEVEARVTFGVRADLNDFADMFAIAWNALEEQVKT